MTENIPAVMTIAEAAEVMQMHHTTLRRAIADGRLPASRPDGRAFRIPSGQLQQWLENTSTSTRSPKKIRKKLPRVTCELDGCEDHRPRSIRSMVRVRGVDADRRGSLETAYGATCIREVADADAQEMWVHPECWPYVCSPGHTCTAPCDSYSGYCHDHSTWYEVKPSKGGR